MANVQRRKSTLNLSPIAPAGAQTAPPAEATPPVPPAPAALAAPTTEEAPELQKKRSYASTDSVERRLRAAYIAVSGHGGRYRSYNDFRLDAMTRLAAEVERELNDGNPFTDAPEKFTPGRKLGSI